MKKLYYVTAYRWSQNEWWRYAITAESDEQAKQRMIEGYPDMHFTRVNAQYICETPQEVFDEL